MEERKEDQGERVVQHPDWLYAAAYLANETPSRKDGVSLEAETLFRRLSILRLITFGEELGLEMGGAIATAAMYFHRFYIANSVAPFPADDALDKTERDVAGTCSPWPLIGASLFLASKVLEEITVEKLKEFKKVLVHALYKKMSAGGQFRRMEGSTYEAQLLTNEMHLLRALNFDVNTRHPFQLAASYARRLDQTELFVRPLCVMARDCLATPLPLQYNAHQLTCGMIELTCRFRQHSLRPVDSASARVLDTPSDPTIPINHWSRKVGAGVPQALLDDICAQMLSFYEDVVRETRNC